jgi:predicted ATPase/class 3 adenylate cyclase
VGMLPATVSAWVLEGPVPLLWQYFVVSRMAPMSTAVDVRLVLQFLAADDAAVAAQPSGTVTLVFTDIEGSTALLDEIGAEAFKEALADHRRALREAFGAHLGYEVDDAGDGLFYAFASGSQAVTAVAHAMASLADGPVRVRVGVHTGEPLLDPPKYVGPDVHKAARIMSAAHGGQVLLSGATHELVAEDVLDLGRHRLKDFPEPVSLFQLGSARFPPLRTISNTNLPVPLSSFVGREQELAQVVSLIRDEGARLVTLAGPGGTGKTRLAIDAAGELVSEFGAGVFWIGLSPVRDPALVVDTIAQTLGAKQELPAHIGDKQLLLVLDNLEQVVESAVELAALLRACPNLRLLVTSRELLRVDGEVVYPVPALVEPEAVELFCARARTDPDEAVVELCGRLDNLPLALELAAARVSVLTPPQILERISQRLDLFTAGRDADPRQQTLRATIAWSYDLLTTDEQRLFARMAVFRGGCTLEAAEEVVDANLDALQSLVDKSLVRHTKERFWMLETIREYAHELLEGSNEVDAMRGRHADHYLALSELAYMARFERGLTWARRLEGEHDNLRAALDHLQDRDPLHYLQLAGALGWFWGARSHFTEGARGLEDALASTVEDGSLTARALTFLGSIDAARGQSVAGLSRLEQAIELWHTVGDDIESAAARDELAWALYEGGGESRPLQLFQQNLELARRLGHHTLVNRSLAGVCQMLVVTGQFERAEPLALELHASMRDSEDVVYMGAADHYLSDCAMHRRDYTLAEQHRLSALETALTTENVMQQAIEIHGLALTAAGLGRDEDALRLEGAVNAKYEELGASLGNLPFYQAWRERDLGAARARLGEPRANAVFAEGRAMTWDQAIELALASEVAQLVRAVQ